MSPELHSIRFAACHITNVKPIRRAAHPLYPIICQSENIGQYLANCRLRWKKTKCRLGSHVRACLILQEVSGPLGFVAVEAYDKEMRFMKRFLIAVVVIGIAIGGKYGCDVLSYNAQWRSGKAQADHDWQFGEPVLFTSNVGGYLRYESDMLFRDLYDRETGLIVKPKFRQKQSDRPGFYEGYNSTISQCIKQHGFPPGSLRGHIPSNQDLISALKSSELKEISTFPADITDNLVIVDGGTFSRWGTTSGGEGIRIEARFGGSISVGNGTDVVHVGRWKSDPQIVLIRLGNCWIGAFHEDGRYICDGYANK